MTSDETIAAARAAVTQRPHDALARCELGDAYSAARRFDDALAEYVAAAKRDPRLARAWYAAGCVESAREEYAAAVPHFARALELEPQWAEATHNMGRALFELGCVHDAVRCFEAAATGPRPGLPRAMLAVVIPQSPDAGNETVLDVRRAWAREFLPPAPAGEPRTARSRTAHTDARLRIGYVSSFFHRPNWMKPVWGLINHHDRARFEIHLFSDAPPAMGMAGYHPHDGDHLHAIAGRSNADVAERIAHHGIDVLVDLNGFSRLERLPLFALRPAPVIAGWFNMFATTGMPAFDYLIGDDVVIPPDEERWYGERIVRVPGSYLTFGVSYAVPGVAAPPCGGGRPVTFGCLASQYKITDDVIAVWCHVLDRVPGSTLIVRNATLSSAATRAFVLERFVSRGIAPGRVRLLGRADHVDFLRTYDDIDVALDTFPYNGGTTTTEALWQGVPVVTYRGDRWASRTSASILCAAGLGELVARDVEGYVSLAAALAAPDAADRLATLRRSMRARLRASAVCDTESFARNMEEIYQRMYQERSGR